MEFIEKLINRRILATATGKRSIVRQALDSQYQNNY